MKKFIKLFIVLMLSLACFMSVACGGVGDNGGNNGDNNGNNGNNNGANTIQTNRELYETFINQISDIESMTFSLDMNVIGAMDSEIYVNEVKGNGGLTISQNDLTFALEMQSKATYGLTDSYKSESNVYFSNNKLYSKMGYEEDGAMEYFYDVEEMEMDDMVGVEGSFITDPEFIQKLTDVITAVEENTKEDTLNFAEKAIEMFFTVTKTADGFELKLDSAKIKAVYGDLKTLTIKQFIDKYFGENTFDELKANVNNLLDKTVNEIKAEIDEITGDKFDSLLEDVVGIILEMEEVTGTTAKAEIDKVLAEYGEVKLSKLLSEVLGVTEDELKANVGAIFGQCEVSTAFYLMGVTETAEIDAIIDMLAGAIELSFKFDNTGKLLGAQIALELTMDGEQMDIKLAIEFGKQFADLQSKITEITTNAQPA